MTNSSPLAISCHDLGQAFKSIAQFFGAIPAALCITICLQLIDAYRWLQAHWHKPWLCLLKSSVTTSTAQPITQTLEPVAPLPVVLSVAPVCGDHRHHRSRTRSNALGFG